MPKSRLVLASRTRACWPRCCPKTIGPELFGAAYLAAAQATSGTKTCHWKPFWLLSWDWATAVLGVPPGAKEAIQFAVLASEAVAGQPVAIGAGRQRAPAVRMGKVLWPG